MAPPSWSDKFKRRIDGWRKVGKLGGPWVVAVSGGSDSVGLLFALRHLAPDLEISVAHLDHGARANSLDDAEFVSELASTLGVSFDIGHWKPTRKGHFEADARQARYAWLVEVARERGATAIAVGHTRDDQAETILHRILRGTGPEGLKGMAWKRRLTEEITLVRPLLDAGRTDLRDYLTRNRQSWLEDSTNTNLEQTRARLRHDLIPKLAAEYNPKVVEALARLGSMIASERKGFDTLLEPIEADVLQSISPELVKLDLAKLGRLERGLVIEVLRRVWGRAAWPEREMDALRWVRLARFVAEKGSTRISVGSGVEAIKRDGLLLLTRFAMELGEEYFLDLEVPVGKFVDRPLGRLYTRWIAAATLNKENLDVEVLDFDKVKLPLILSSAKEGDRFDPLGMYGQSTPLADFFRGRGIHKRERQRVPIVRDQQGIIWVVGHRISDRVKVTRQSKRFLELLWVPTCG